MKKPERTEDKPSPLYHHALIWPRLSHALIWPCLSWDAYDKILALIVEFKKKKQQTSLTLNAMSKAPDQDMKKGI